MNNRIDEIPPQHQGKTPGVESEMVPPPQSGPKQNVGCGKLEDKIAIITGGDSGIGRAVAVAFAKEGADVAIIYLNEHEDAAETKRIVENEDGKCLLISGDVGEIGFCQKAVDETIEHFGSVDLLINNAAEQHVAKDILNITEDQLVSTFRTNFFGYFFMTQSVLKHMKKGSSIINTTSVTAYKGSPELIDYSATKGAIVAFTRSLSLSLISKGIRVNGVAPGPIWTPLIPSTFDEEKIQNFGKNTPMKRPGQPEEVAPCYVFLASDESSYINGQILHPNGGEIVNG